MRKIISLSLLFLLFSMNGIGQNSQNMNWYFGADNWINFGPIGNNINNVPTPTTFIGGTGLDLSEGCASVSDSNGNLLFVTDGVSVYQNMGTTFNLVNIVPLMGESSSAQNAIIVPRPNFPNQYYIFTITGLTSQTDNPDFQTGLYYSLFDFNLANPQVFVNTPLNFQQNSTPIDGAFGNTSEAITSIISDDCNDTWVVAHVNNQNVGGLLSYRVTANGVVGNNPTNFLPLHIAQSNSVFAKLLKIAHVNNGNLNIHRTALGINTTGIDLGTFNINTGVFGNGFPLVLGTAAIDLRGLEFSPNSTMLYYSDGGVGIASSFIRRYNILANNIQGLIAPQNTSFYGMQLSIDNNIYIITKINSVASLTVINFPDDATLPLTLNVFQALLNNSTMCLPQWVWSGCCLPTLVLRTSTNDNMTNNSPLFIIQREREFWIDAANVIGIGNNAFQNGVVYHAGEFVDLTPGFDAVNGSQFTAYIQGCSGSYSYKNSNSNTSSNSMESIRDVKEGLAINPNPSNSTVEILLNNNSFNRIAIVSIDGKKVYEAAIESSNKLQVDVSNYANGLYIVTVTASDGQQFSKKLIKN